MAARRLQAKYAERILCPRSALGEVGTGDLNLITADGVECAVRFLGTWNNAEGRFNDDLEMVCQNQLGIGFDTVRSIWISRLNGMSDIWDMIELKKL